MRSLENFKQKTENNLPENEVEIPRQETPVKNEEEAENSAETNQKKAENFISNMRGHFESREATFKKIVAKGVLGFALSASLLAAYPQYEAVAAENTNVTNEHVLKNSTEKTDSQGDEAARKLTEELANFADNNLKEREEDFKELIHTGKERLEKKEEGTAETSSDDSRKTTGSIDFIPEGGIMITFSGDFRKIKDVFKDAPGALVEELKEIKSHPILSLTYKLLNMQAVDAGKEINHLTDKYGASGYEKE